jgi:hypothetical protein
MDIEVLIMTELEDLMKDIEILRDKLQLLIKQKRGDLIDPDVVAASKILNAALNQYNKLLGEKIEKSEP